MTPTSEVIRLAQESDVWIPLAEGHEKELALKRLGRLISLAKAEEREACRLIAISEYDMRTAAYNDHTPEGKALALAGVQAAASIHQAIRARTKEAP